MIQKLDRIFYRRFEQFAHWWQRLTGYTSYWLAKWSAAGVACHTLLVLTSWWMPELWVSTLSTELPIPSLFWTVYALLIFLEYGVYNFVLCDRADTSWWSGHSASRPIFVLRFQRGSTRLFRSILVFLACLGLALMFLSLALYILVRGELPKGGTMWRLSAIFFTFWPCFHYWVTVSPLPPGQSKLGQLKDKMLAKLTSVVLKPAAAHS